MFCASGVALSRTPIGTAGGGLEIECASGPQLLVLAGGEKAGESRRRAKPGACRLNPTLGAVFVSRREFDGRARSTGILAVRRA